MATEASISGKRLRSISKGVDVKQELDRKIETMEEHLDDIIFDLVQTIQSFEEMGAHNQTGLISHMMQAKTQIQLAREVISRDCK